MNKILFFLSFFLFYANFTHGAIKAIPGEVIAIKDDGGFNQQGQKHLKINFEKQTYILIPIPYTANNKSAQFNGMDISIVKKDFGESRITINDLSKVDLSKEDSERAFKESIKIKDAINSYSIDFNTSIDFVSPIPSGIISSRYGKKRFINNTPRSPHLSLDIAAPEGTPIEAPSQGRIILTGNFFYAGNYLIIDHGYGLLSSYSHMSEIYIQTGDFIDKGKIIGTVGSTGRVTGPHLHWTVYLNTVRINPESLLKKDYLQSILQISKDII
jgi:murein DD-endopeptidase MepM/ murein hydrolase activator NlpD|tara:strand:+ start:2410 stop:3222 length:813 start_codon:yes stop_codon:yes gene_type:complete